MDFDILFVRCIVRVIYVDVIVTFRQIDGEVATEQETSATNTFDEDGYTLDTFVLGVESLALNRNFVSFPLNFRASFILLEIYISHIYSSFLLGPSQKGKKDDDYDNQSYYDCDNYFAAAPAS